MQIFLLLSAFAALRALAEISISPSRVLDLNRLSNPNIDSSSPILPPPQPEKRATRKKCSPPTYPGNGNGKRDSFVGVQDLNFTLDRRTMKVPAGAQASDMDDWMRAEMTEDLFQSIIWEKMVYGEPEQMATSLYDLFKDKAFSMGTDGLRGCTTLVIISRKAVYMAHYWESISFNPDPEWVEEYGSPEACFQQTVIKGLTKGTGPPSNREQVSLKGYADKFQDPYVHAYLMIPSMTNDDIPDGYQDKWELIKQTVNSFMPNLSTGDRWTEVTYEALPENDPELGDTAMGRILFKYDPDENDKRRAALWVERNAVPYHNDMW